ncbi:MAG: adenylate/guanylate cyclase domain-containing protein [Magnetococcus sp. YQC-3]
MSQIFEKEQKIIEQAAAYLQTAKVGDADLLLFCHKLLDDYIRLHKSSNHLVKFSDRNEKKLNDMAKMLDQKNKMLEDLSGQLSKYLSPQVYDSIFSGARHASLTTERKKLTVFFSDIKDFTKTTDNMQPEDLTWLLNSYFTEMSKIAIEHDATIDKFIGDAMLMFFGDPKTKGVKEDALSCVRMAIAMQRRMKELVAVWHERGFQYPFQMRIGINTGYCNVGNFGSEIRMDYTIIGGEVNLAARLESMADPGGILMSFETYSHVKDIFAAEERPPIKVKGIQRDVQPFAILGLNPDADISNDEQFIRRCRGLLVNLDLRALQSDDLSATMRELAEVLQRLDNTPADKGSPDHHP